MKNIFHIYKRSYNDLYEIFANVGGIPIIQSTSLINYYYHRFMIKYDFIFFSREK